MLHSNDISHSPSCPLHLDLRKEVLALVGRGKEESSPKILLHACCAPCSGAIIEALCSEGLFPTVFFSNSNIVPREEYDKRLSECRRYCGKYSLTLIEDSYDHLKWLEEIRGLENEPERGRRCLKCFGSRLSRSALYAHENGFDILTTTLASSRWKVLSQVDEAGKRECEKYEGLTWWGRNWRKGGLQERRSRIITEEEFYNQDYCGCEFSFRKNAPAPATDGE